MSLRKFIIATAGLLVATLVFFISNGAMLDYIFFTETQSIFTLNDYVMIWIVSSVIMLLFISSVALYLKTSEKEPVLDRFIGYELMMFSGLGIGYMIFYLVGFYNPSDAVINLTYQIGKRDLGVMWFYLELLLFVLVLLNEIKKIIKRKQG